MILFKRARDSLRHIEGREWALLVLETLGVLAGILLAFELQEWASRRSEAARHRELLERLFEESEQDVAVTRSIRDIMRRLGKQESQFATLLSAGECPDEKLWGAVGSVTVLPSLAPPRSVYDEMMGSGGLTSIREESVRDAIKLFTSALKFGEGQNDYFRGVQVPPVSSGDNRVRLRFDAHSRGLETADYDRAALCADRAFRNRMIEATATHLKAVSYHDTATERAIVMCGALGASLGKSCQPTSGGPLAGDDLKTLRASTQKTP